MIHVEFIYEFFNVDENDFIRLFSSSSFIF